MGTTVGSSVGVAVSAGRGSSVAGSTVITSSVAGISVAFCSVASGVMFAAVGNSVNTSFGEFIATGPSVFAGCLPELFVRMAITATAIRISAIAVTVVIRIFVLVLFFTYLAPLPA
ncbi:MAG: hypothetical protein J6X34_01780 [Clostridia bacterium]|nr:hypothetical protein [Clostridia bacterium]